MTKPLLIYGLTLGLLNVGIPRAAAQTPFVNLNFELGPIRPPTQPAFFLPISSAMPGWTGYINGQVVDTVWYNNISLGSSALALHGPGWFVPAPQGRYWAMVQPASSPLDDPPGTAFLGQTGTVPTDAMSITFIQIYNLPMTLSFHSQDIPLYLLGTFEAHNQVYFIQGGDVSRFAGQTGELLFGGGRGDGGAFDDVRFSTEMVPEPSGIAVIGLFAVLGAMAWRRVSTPPPLRL